MPTPERPNNEKKERPIKDPAVILIDDPTEYSRILEEAGGGSADDEGLLTLKPALNTPEGLYVYRPAFERIGGFDVDFLDWIIEHERFERELDSRGRSQNPDDKQFLESLGITEKHPGDRKDEEPFFRAIHASALRREIELAEQSGKVDTYIHYLENYLSYVRNKIDTGEWHEDDELVRAFFERQQERMHLLKTSLQQSFSEQPANANSELAPDIESQIAEQQMRARRDIGKLYDEAMQEGISPIEKFLSHVDTAREARYVFGDEPVDAFLNKARTMYFGSKEEFVDQLIEWAVPFTRPRFENPEVRKRMDEYAAMTREENMHAGKLLVEARPSEWEFSVGGKVITIHSKILEIQWPHENAPKGLADIKEALAAIADILKKDESIEAVVGESWMMSHPIVQRLGFEAFPDVQIPEDRKDSILSWATKARRDKPYKDTVQKKDIMVGAMTRDAFLQRYG